MKPSVGRMVHYYDGVNLTPWPAVIYRVNEDGSVDLTVLIPGTYGANNVRENLGDTFWVWPPRVD